MRYLYLLAIVVLSGIWSPLFAQNTDDVIVVWNGDGRLLATGIGATVSVLDTTTGTLFTVFSVDAPIKSMAWSHTGGLLAVGVSKDVIIWSVTDNRQHMRFSPYDRGFVTHVEWSPDDRSILATIFARAFVWDLESNQARLTLQQNPGPMLKGFWSPDGSRIATVGDDTQVWYWSATTGENIGGISVPHDNVSFRINDSVFNPDGTFIATTTQTDGKLRIWTVSVKGAELVDAFTISQTEESEIEWSVDGALIAQREGPRLIHIWDVAQGQKIETISFDTDVNSIAYSPFGGRLAVGQQSTNEPVRLLIPAPSLDRLNAIAELCVRDAPTRTRAVSGLTSHRLTSLNALPDFVAQVESLPEGAIPAACRADLLAVADALR